MSKNKPFCYCDQAPRAKMNQQRSRRFRASKESVELSEEKSRIREEVISRGVCVMCLLFPVFLKVLREVSLMF